MGDNKTRGQQQQCHSHASRLFSRHVSWLVSTLSRAASPVANLSIPTWRILGFPNHPKRCGNTLALVQVGPLNNLLGSFGIMCKFGIYGCRVITPLFAAIIKLSHAIELISLMLESDATRPFFPKFAKVDQFLGLDHCNDNVDHKQVMNRVLFLARLLVR